MADIHIEEFYKDLARILLHLHNYFPRKSQIYVEDICGPDTPDEFGLHSTRHQSCFSAMLWLADEGFMRFEETIRQEAIDQAVLTQTTFVKLNRLAQFPGSIMQDDPILAPLLQHQKVEPVTNIQLVKFLLKNATSTQLAQMLESILFTH